MGSACGARLRLSLEPLSSSRTPSNGEDESAYDTLGLAENTYPLHAVHEMEMSTYASLCLTSSLFSPESPKRPPRREATGHAD